MTGNTGKSQRPYKYTQRGVVQAYAKIILADAGKPYDQTQGSRTADVGGCTSDASNRAGDVGNRTLMQRVVC